MTMSEFDKKIDAMKPSMFSDEHYKRMTNKQLERHHAKLSAPYKSTSTVLNDNSEQIEVCLEMNPSFTIEDLKLIFTERALMIILKNKEIKACLERNQKKKIC